MDDALKLAREFEHAMCRFRRMDYSALHPGVGNMEFAVLEMIHKLSAQHDAIYGAAISDLQKKMEEAAEALEFEEAARYRDLFNSVKAGVPEAENHGQRRGGQGHHCAGQRRKRRSGTGVFCAWRQADRARAFLYDACGGFG